MTTDHQQIQAEVNAAFDSPWKSELPPGAGVRQITNANHEDIAWLCGDNPIRDGRLIEAAPELLAVCQTFLAKWRANLIGSDVRESQAEIRAIASMCEDAIRGIASGLQVNVETEKAKQPPQSDVEDALELCDEIEREADEVPDAGEDFAERAREKASNIRARIEETGRVTPKQLTALENMESGLYRWIR